MPASRTCTPAATSPGWMSPARATYAAASHQPDQPTPASPTPIRARQSGPVFATRTGTTLERHSAARTLRILAAELDPAPFSPHVLRHTLVNLAQRVRPGGRPGRRRPRRPGHHPTLRPHHRIHVHPTNRLLSALAATPTRQPPGPHTAPIVTLRQTPGLSHPRLRLVRN